jgi:transposase
VREGGGQEALRRHPAPGRRGALTAEQLQQLPELLGCGAESYGFQGNQWTTTRIAAVLQQVYGITYHPAHVSRLLSKYFPGWRRNQKS